MLEAMLRELDLRKKYLEESKLSSVYFGGGTPSILLPADVERLLHKVNKLFEVEAGAEITLEANPDDITSENLSAWRQTGINRLSIGIQSFKDVDLQLMNRAHNSQHARQCVDWAREAGFDNFSIDLIYGIPGQSMADWQANLAEAARLQVPHLSCYALTVEPKTALAHQVKTKTVAHPDDGEQAAHFQYLRQWAKENGYRHYEISNLCLPGKEARHNSSYWEGVHYLGIGPGAHSYNGHSRQWNVSNNARYIKAQAKGELLFEQEELSAADTFNEYLLTGLRRLEKGIDLKIIEDKFGVEAVQALMENARPHLRRQHLVQKGHQLLLSEKGIFIADGITADLFLTDEAFDREHTVS